jgi:predicted oxidoreductase
MTPLNGPTYYAVRLWPGGPNTQGGPRRNPDGQVMRVTGEPVPGLYTAGELGSVYGMLYPSGGGNIAECLLYASMMRISGVELYTAALAGSVGSGQVKRAFMSC